MVMKCDGDGICLGLITWLIIDDESCTITIYIINILSNIAPCMQNDVTLISGVFGHTHTPHGPTP